MAEPLPAKPRVATLWLPDIQDWGLAGYDPRRGVWVLIEGGAAGDLGPDRVADLVEARWNDGTPTDTAPAATPADGQVPRELVRYQAERVALADALHDAECECGDRMDHQATQGVDYSDLASTVVSAGWVPAARAAPAAHTARPAAEPEWRDVSGLRKWATYGADVDLRVNAASVVRMLNGAPQQPTGARPAPAEPDSSEDRRGLDERYRDELQQRVDDALLGDPMVAAALARRDARRAAQPGPDAEQPGDGIDPTIASGYRLEDIRGYSPRDLGCGADGHTDEQAGGEQA